MQRFKVAFIGLDTLFGKISSFLLKQSPYIKCLKLYDDKNISAGRDLAEIYTDCKVRTFLGNDQLNNALNGADVVIIGDEASEHETCVDKVLHDAAGKVINYARAISKSAPEAIIILAASPLNILFPLLTKALIDRGTYNSNKVFGCTAADTLCANYIMAKHLNADPKEVVVPVIGGSSEESRVPLLSHANPYCPLPQETIHSIIECIKNRSKYTLEAKGMSDTINAAYANYKFLHSVFAGLRGEQNVIDITMSRTDLVTGVEYFSLPVVLGMNGISNRYQLPKLNFFEKQMLAKAIVSLKNDANKARFYEDNASPKSEMRYINYLSNDIVYANVFNNSKNTANNNIITNSIDLFEREFSAIDLLASTKKSEICIRDPTWTKNKESIQYYILLGNLTRKLNVEEELNDCSLVKDEPIVFLNNISSSPSSIIHLENVFEKKVLNPNLSKLDHLERAWQHLTDKHSKDNSENEANKFKSSQVRDEMKSDSKLQNLLKLHTSKYTATTNTSNSPSPIINTSNSPSPIINTSNSPSTTTNTSNSLSCTTNTSNSPSPITNTSNSPFSITNTSNSPSSITITNNSPSTTTNTSNSLSCTTNTSNSPSSIANTSDSTCSITNVSNSPSSIANTRNSPSSIANTSNFACSITNASNFPSSTTNNINISSSTTIEIKNDIKKDEVLSSSKEIQKTSVKFPSENYKFPGNPAKNLYNRKTELAVQEKENIDKKNETTTNAKEMNEMKDNAKEVKDAKEMIETQSKDIHSEADYFSEQHNDNKRKIEEKARERVPSEGRKETKSDRNKQSEKVLKERVSIKPDDFKTVDHREKPKIFKKRYSNHLLRSKGPSPIVNLSNFLQRDKYLNTSSHDSALIDLGVLNLDKSIQTEQKHKSIDQQVLNLDKSIQIGPKRKSIVQQVLNLDKCMKTKPKHKSIDQQVLNLDKSIQTGPKRKSIVQQVLNLDKIIKTKPKHKSIDQHVLNLDKTIQTEPKYKSIDQKVLHLDKSIQTDPKYKSIDQHVLTFDKSIQTEQKHKSIDQQLLNLDKSMQTDPKYKSTDQQVLNLHKSIQTEPKHISIDQQVLNLDKSIQTESKYKSIDQKVLNLDKSFIPENPLTTDPKNLFAKAASKSYEIEGKQSESASKSSIGTKFNRNCENIALTPVEENFTSFRTSYSKAGIRMPSSPKKQYNLPASSTATTCHKPFNYKTNKSKYKTNESTFVDYIEVMPSYKHFKRQVSVSKNSASRKCINHKLRNNKNCVFKNNYELNNKETVPFVQENNSSISNPPIKVKQGKQSLISMCTDSNQISNSKFKPNSNIKVNDDESKLSRVCEYNKEKELGEATPFQSLNEEKDTFYTNKCLTKKDNKKGCLNEKVVCKNWYLDKSPFKLDNENDGVFSLYRSLSMKKLIKSKIAKLNLSSSKAVKKTQSKKPVTEKIDSFEICPGPRIRLSQIKRTRKTNNTEKVENSNILKNSVARKEKPAADSISLSPKAATSRRCKKVPQNFGYDNVPLDEYNKENNFPSLRNIFHLLDVNSKQTDSS